MCAFVSVCSNPNDPGPNQESQRSTLPDRARLKNIEWTAYESVHKKYLSLGEHFSTFFFSYVRDFYFKCFDKLNFFVGL